MSENLGRYKILGEIGQGGFAIVHRAHDTQLDRLVALKELRPILLRDTGWVKRFRNEARTIARLDHPNIVTIHDVSDFGERLFIVMRLVNGPSLEKLLTERGSLPWSEAVEIIKAVGEGLNYAHMHGILHRDLKPANILIDPERGPMLSDFGLATLVGESSMGISASGSVVGTPYYIAPELWEGQKATRQSDIYALGCILSEMLTGEKVFKGETPPTVMMAHFRPPALPATWPKGVPAGAASVLKTTLASNPSDRYATVDDLSQALIALSDTLPEPTRAGEIASGQQNITTTVEPAPQLQMILQETGPESFAQAPDSAAAVPQTSMPFRQFTEHTIRNNKLNFQKLEDAIADLPPKWHGFIKSLSLSVLVIFMLAIANLFTSSYPWFIWLALAAGIFLAIRFTNLLFAVKSEAINLPIPAVQPPPPSDPSPSSSSPNAVQQTPILPPAANTQAATPSPGAGTPTTEPLPIAQAAAAPTASQTMRAREQRKRSGCMWITLALGGILLILVVGIGGFCTVFGNLLQTSLATVEVGSTLTKEINVAVPDTVSRPELSLSVVGGQLFLAPGAKNGLVEGTVTYNVVQLTPTIDIDGGTIRIYPEEDIGLAVLTTEQLENTWDLTLASSPMVLSIEVEAANAEIELGSLSVADLDLTHGAGEFNLSFSEPNQINMKNLTFEGGASSTRLIGLANARAENISIEAGAGDFTLDFAGELQHDVDVELDTGASAVTISVPDNVAATVVVDDTLSTVEVLGTWHKTNDDQYVLPGEGPEITITANIGFGTLRLQTSAQE